MKLHFLIIWPLLMGLLAGCGTLSSRSQKIPVYSDDPAVVEINGKKAGISPQIVELRRGKEYDIKLRNRDKQTKELSLKSGFRWNESFSTPAILSLFINTPALLLTSLAVDYWTGALWEFEEPVKVQFRPKPSIAPVKSIAILPPIADRELLSEEVAGQVRKWAADKYGPSYLMSDLELDSTLESFGVTYQSRPSRQSYLEIHEFFQPSHYLDTQVFKADDRAILHIQLVDFWSQQTVQEHLIHQPTSDYKSYSWYAWFREQLYQMVPNSLGMGYLVPTSTQEYYEPKSGGKIKTGELADGAVTNLILTARNSRHFRQRQPMNISFRFTPTATLSRSTFIHEIWSNVYENSDPNVIKKYYNRYESILFAFGFGPEFQFDTTFGTLSVNFSSNLGYEELRSYGKTERKTYSDTIYFADAKASFSSFLTETILMSIEAGRGVRSALNWGDVVKDMYKLQPGRYYEGDLVQLSQDYISLTFLYYLPGGRSRLKRKIQKIEKDYF